MSRKFQVKVIPSKWIVNDGFRLDCGPYLSGAMEARELLAKHHTERLDNLTRGYGGGIYNGPQFSRNYVDNPDYGVPFLTTSTMQQADITNLPHISSKDARSPRLSYLEVAEKMTLITCSGNIGKIVYSRKDMVGCWSNQDIMKVVADKDKILPGYLYAFLAGRFGIPLVIGGTYGAIIQHIEPSHLANLPVPRLGAVEQQAHDLVQRAAECLTASSTLLQTATLQLFETAGLIEPQRNEYLDDMRRLGWIESAHSMFSLRALYYDPRVKDLMNQVTSVPFDKLGDLVMRDNFEGHIIFRRIDSDEEHGIKLLGQRDAFQLRPEGRWISEKSIEGLGLEVPPGTTLIACHGTLGETELYCRAAYVTPKNSNYAYSGDFYRCIPKTELIPPGYLYAFLRSNLAFRIIRAMSTGSKQQYPHPVLMAEMPIPRLDKEIELEIGEKVERAAILRDKALQLEDDARALVEHAIEEGGR